MEDKDLFADTSADIATISLLDALNRIVELARDSNLSEAFFAKGKPYIDFVADKFAITPLQAVLFAACLETDDDGDRMRNTSMSSFLGCSTRIKSLELRQDLLALSEKRLLRHVSWRGRETFDVPQKVIDALSRNEVYKLPKTSNLKASDFFLLASDFISQVKRQDIETEDFQLEVQNLIDSNQQLPFVQCVNDLSLCWYERAVLVYMCCILIKKGSVEVEMNDMYDLFNHSSSIEVRDMLLKHDSPLFDKDLISNVCVDGIADSGTFQLTDKGRKDLLTGIELTVLKIKDTQGIVPFETLNAKPLFYNPAEKEQIDELADALSIERFKGVQDTLAANGLRKGFTCLFYGLPGTGKTETVNQLAIATKRNIMPINVSQIKSMWVGATEHNMQEVFDRYRYICAHSAVVPILFFNEADALFGKRMEGAEREVDKMSNALQNIILEGMEKLDGILIATTNLTGSLDHAFERRFFYKIRFDKPSKDARMAIWKSMIGDLNDEQACELASNYDFSGGQIENIARRMVVSNIMLGHKGIDMNVIRKACEAEKVTFKKGTLEATKKVGY
jgi:hypothetical protein